MNQKNNTALVVTVAVSITLIIVMIVAIILLSSNIFSINLSQSSVNQESTELINQKQTTSKTPDESTVVDNPTTMYVTNVKNSIYLRSEPVEDDKNIITTIPVGEQVVWIENTNIIFSKISYNGTNGYVKRDYLSTKKPPLNTVTSGNTAIYKYMYVTNVKNSIYLRSSAEENSDNVITTIPLGTEIGFIEHTNNVFSKINYNGTIGYAKTKYLADSSNNDYTYLTVYNVKKSIYLRSEPRENTDNIICEIPLGTVVRYLGNANGGFYKISYDGYTGYSKSIYLR